MAPRAASLHELSRIVGGLQNAVTNLTDTWKEQDSKATDGRRELYRQVGDMRVELAKLSESIKPLAELKPDVEILMAARHRQQGMVWLARLLFGAIAGLVGALITKYWK